MMNVMCETLTVNKKFEEEDASDDGAQGVVPASADLSGLLEPAPAQTGSLLKLRRCPTRMSRQYHPPLRGLQFRLTFVDPYEDIENCMGIRRGGAFGSPLANNLPLMPRRNLTPEGGSLLRRGQQGGTATEVEDECEATMKRLKA